MKCVHSSHHLPLNSVKIIQTQYCWHENYRIIRIVGQNLIIQRVQFAKARVGTPNRTSFLQLLLFSMLKLRIFLNENILNSTN